MATKLKEVDVVVVGLGWTGGILSKELTQAGLKVVALERGRMFTTATDFGVPQARVRVVFAASRADIPEIKPPAPTHSRAALLRDQESGEYWRGRGLRKKRRIDWPRRVNGESLRLGRDYRVRRSIHDE